MREIVAPSVAGAGYAQIASITADDDANADLFFDSDNYHRWKLTFDDVEFSNDVANLEILISVDGSTFITAGYEYSREAHMSNNTSGDGGSVNDSSFDIANNVSNDAGEVADGTVDFYGLKAGRKLKIIAIVGFFQSNNVARSQFTTGHIDNDSKILGIRIKASSGTISGNFVLEAR